MCLAVPMRLLEIRPDNLGIAVIAGVQREVDLSLVEAQPGEYLIVHAGFAIETLDEHEAMTRLELLRQLGEAGDV